MNGFINLRERSRLPGWLFISIVVAMPIAIVAIDFSTTEGFLGLPRFGLQFRDQALPEIRETVNATIGKRVGYDGQFYAQIALDPTLSRSELQAACDSIGYRAKRIGLPWLASILGGQQPWWVLQIYSSLNLVFWVCLLWLLVRRFGVRSLSQRMLIVAVVLHAGVLISISRALTDLPALCMSLFGLLLLEDRTSESRDREPTDTVSIEHENRPAWWRFATASVASAYACLTKETAVLSLPAYFPSRVTVSGIARSGLLIALTVGPMLAWHAYVRAAVGLDRTGMSNFTLPFVGFFEKMINSWHRSVTDFPSIPILEWIGPLSILIQVIYVTCSMQVTNRWWRFGALYVVLALFIGGYVWEAQSAYSRVLLPLGVAFNVLLWQRTTYATVDQQKQRRALRWWWLGNLGMFDRGAPAIAIWLLSEWWWNRSNRSV